MPTAEPVPAPAPFTTTQEITAGLLTFVRNAPDDTPDAVMELVDAALTAGGRPPEVVRLVRAIWDAGADVSAEVLALGVRLIGWVQNYGQWGVAGGVTVVPAMATAMIRDLGVAAAEGTTWPDPADDPQRGEPEPLAPTLPEPQTPEA